MARFTLRSLYPQGQSPWFPLDRMHALEKCMRAAEKLKFRWNTDEQT
jgi:hypothetical protein